MGKAAKSKGPVIENNVQQSPDWFKEADQMTGFITKSALVVPLLVKETSIGVIEVVNKKDRSLFSKDDENLLSAFAAQAAVAPGKRPVIHTYRPGAKKRLKSCRSCSELTGS